MFAVLGNILFETLTSPDVFRSSTEYNYATHQIVEAAPRLQWMAANLEKISLELSFHIVFTNPATQMNRLRAAANDHQARALVFGNGQHRGYFVIESLEETHQQLADDGSFIAISTRVELKQWIPGADFDPAAPARTANPAPGVVVGAASTAGTSVPGSSVSRLSSVGVGPGSAYSATPYSSPGVSGLATRGVNTGRPATAFSDVLPPTIVRAAS